MKSDHLKQRLSKIRHKNKTQNQILATTYKDSDSSEHALKHYFILSWKSMQSS